jgi:Spy/CpxP family protein refolding chaperone
MITTGRAGVMRAGLVGFALVAVLLAGCSESGDSGGGGLILPQSGSDSGDLDLMVLVPTLDEVQNEIGLREDQVREMQAVLDELRVAIAARSAPMHEMGRRGRRAGGFRHDGEQPLLAFIEKSADILDADQFVTFLEMVGQRQAEHRAARQGAREGGQLWSDRGQANAPGACSDRIAELVEMLDLTEEQQEAIRSAMIESRAAMRALRAEAAGSGMSEEQRDQMREIREQFETRLQQILEPDQYTQWQELREERCTVRLEERLANLDERIDRRIEFLIHVLDLSDVQQEQMSAIRAQTQLQVEALLQSVIDGDIAVEEARSAGELIREEATAAIRDLLTPEQVEIFDALRELRRGHGHRGCGGHRGICF